MKLSLSVRPRMNASGATLDDPALQVLVHAVGLEHVVERVEQGAQVGVDLGGDVAGQEAEPLAGLHCRTGEDDAVDLAARQGRHGHGHREERLAGAGRADPDRDRLAADRVHVALLVDRLGGDLQAAVAPDDILEDAAGALVAIERAGDRLDRAGSDLVALPDQVAELADDGTAHADRLLVAVQREDVPAQVDLAVEVLLERLHDEVLGPCQLGGHLVGKLQLDAHYAISFSFTALLTRLPSARPFTRGITSAITWPISFGEVAPDSARASPTMALSSSSEICSGM